MNRQEHGVTQSVVIDTRPFPVVFLARSYRWLVIIGAAIVFGVIVSLPTPEGLSVSGQKALGVFAVCLILWLTRVIPLAVTSLLAIILLPLLSIMDSGQAFSLFGNQAVFFILGAFILAAALMKSGLSSRMALFFLRRFGRSPQVLLGGTLLVPAFLSLWMPEHAVAAMMFPIVLEIAHGLDLQPHRQTYGESLFLAMAWGAGIGGIGTFLGGARNALAVGILKQTTGDWIGFFEWMVAAVPIALVLLPISYLVIRRYCPIDIPDVTKALEVLERKNRELGRMSPEQKMIGLVMVLTVAAWVVLGGRFELATIAILAVVALFLFQLVRWQDLEEYVNWGVILMYGGAIALGFALDESGAAAWLATTTLANWANTSLALVAMLAFLSLLLTEGMSNAAVVAMLMPVALGIAGQYQIDPSAMVFVVAVPAGLAFMMPLANPPNAIAFSSGFIRLRTMVLVGLRLTVVALVVFYIMALYYWPLVGIQF